MQGTYELAQGTKGSFQNSAQVLAYVRRVPNSFMCISQYNTAVSYSALMIDQLLSSLHQLEIRQTPRSRDASTLWKPSLAALEEYLAAVQLAKRGTTRESLDFRIATILVISLPSKICFFDD